MQDPLRARIATAVERGVIARRRYFQHIDLPDEQRVGGPADPEKVLQLEKQLRVSLPPSYRQFLLMFDGWRMIDGGLDLLSIEELLSGKRKDEIESWQKKMAKCGDEVASRSLVIGTSSVTPTKYLLDPQVVDKSGEWEFVQHHKGEEATVSSFLVWLEESVEEYNKLASGEDEDEDE